MGEINWKLLFCEIMSFHWNQRYVCLLVSSLTLTILRKHFSCSCTCVDAPLCICPRMWFWSCNVIRTEWKTGLGPGTGRNGAWQQPVSCVAVSELNQTAISLISSIPVLRGADLMVPSAQEAAGTGIQGKRIRHGCLRCNTFNCL